MMALTVRTGWSVRRIRTLLELESSFRLYGWHEELDGKKHSNCVKFEFAMQSQTFHGTLTHDCTGLGCSYFPWHRYTMVATAEFKRPVGENYKAKKPKYVTAETGTPDPDCSTKTGKGTAKEKMKVTLSGDYLPYPDHMIDPEYPPLVSDLTARVTLPRAEEMGFVHTCVHGGGTFTHTEDTRGWEVVTMQVYRRQWVVTFDDWMDYDGFAEEAGIDPNGLIALRADIDSGEMNHWSEGHHGFWACGQNGCRDYDAQFFWALHHKPKK
jgi:hypothetical protein